MVITMTDTITSSRTAAELVFRAISIKHPRLAVKLHPWLLPLEQAIKATQQGRPNRSIQVPTKDREMQASDVLTLIDRLIGEGLVSQAIKMVEEEGIRYE